MTERKPAFMGFPDWVEFQIRTAEAAGVFDDLPGKGKPIPGIDVAQHELAWVANKLRSENVDVAGVLPPALALAKEAEELPVRLLAERDEAAARAVATDLNARIDAAWAAPQVGVPMRVKLVDVDAAVAQWRATRDEVLARRRAAALEVAPQPRRRHLLRRRAV